MSAADKNHEPSHLSDAHNRLVDAGLAEVVGGQSPPDLSSQIMAAYESGRVSPAQVASSVGSTRRFKWVSVAVAASLLVGMGYVILSPESNQEQQTPIAWGYSELRSNRDKQTKIAEHVEEFNRLRDEQRYEEMEGVARRLNELAPEDPVAQQIWQNTKFIRREMLNRSPADEKGTRIWDQLNAVEATNNPVAEDGVEAGRKNKEWYAYANNPKGVRGEKEELPFGLSNSDRELAQGQVPPSAGPWGMSSDGRVSRSGGEYGVPLTTGPDYGSGTMGVSKTTAGGTQFGLRRDKSDPQQPAAAPVPSGASLGIQGVAIDAGASQPAEGGAAGLVTRRRADQKAIAALGMGGNKPAGPEGGPLPSPASSENSIGLQGLTNDEVADNQVAASNETLPLDVYANGNTREYKKQLQDQPTAGSGPIDAASMPSAYFVTDDVQYHPPHPSEFRLSREAAALSESQKLTTAPGQVTGPSAADSLKLAVTPRIIVQEEGLEEALGVAAPTPEGSGPGKSGDKYVPIVENPFIKAIGGEAVSTFSIDVDTASYSNVRQFLMESNQLPPADAVRIEELVNYFEYDYTPPKADDEAPFAAHVEVASCPWNVEHRLARVAVKGREMDKAKRPQSNLVFLVDVSGSMNEPAKLPLVVYGLERLTKELGENDHIAIVVYASSEGLVLPSTSGTKQKEILDALSKLQAGGSTAGGAGIQLAYQIAEDNFIKGGTNRVILCTDGDFNVGVTSTGELQKLVEKKAKDTGVFLSVLGFGRGNLNDAMMEAIADHGNGNYHYVDNQTEARRVLVEQMTGTLVTIAKDVKIQVEFNPAKVAGYRLVGYENRMLRTEDFNDDKKDAGEIGAGHTVTALYEIVPTGKEVDVVPVDDLKYQKSAASPVAPTPPATVALPAGPYPSSPSPVAPQAPVAPVADGNVSDELLTLKMRYKAPDGDTSKKLEWPVKDDAKTFSDASDDYQFASAVAGFGLMLRDSQYKGNLTLAAVLELAQGGVGRDEKGYRSEFLDMVRKAKQLKGE